MLKKPGILYDRRYFDHHVDLPSPENPNRIRNLYQTLETKQYAQRLQTFKPREAGIDEIRAVHSQFYLEQIREYATDDNPYGYDPDTYLMEESLYTASLATGGCLELADRILSTDIDYGFALIRPPGHHAEPGRGMGFCIFNNAAITAEYLRRVYGLQRILILDYDAHHGNGTQAAFYETDEVLTVSIHQGQLFPFTGAASETGTGKGSGYTINLPVFQQFSDKEYSFLLGKILGAVVEQYLPQIIIVSAGYDAHTEETISKIDLTTDWFRSITELLKYLANESCDNRLLCVLEGGYNPVSLEESVLTTLDSLMEPVGKRPGIVHSERGEKVLAGHPLHSHWTI
jgi:acetoin utilization deacetylase AcuC-like enzyme